MEMPPTEMGRQILMPELTMHALRRTGQLNDTNLYPSKKTTTAMIDMNQSINELLTALFISRIYGPDFVLNPR
jgi:hypothetical protein